LPNCGSVFVSDPSTYEKHGPPGAIIEKLGFKGVRRGGAQVSPQHANFIVNTGGATSADVVALIRDISHAAHRELSVSLSAEVRYVSADGISYPATEIPFEFSEPMV
jgi:UDP-N-acetylmuramate dehydrogenase